MASKLIIEILEDGTIKTDGREMIGSEAQMKDALELLAQEVGGELTVEKHVPGVKHEHHHHEHSHLLVGGGHGHKH